MLNQPVEPIVDIGVDAQAFGQVDAAMARTDVVKERVKVAPQNSSV